MLETSIEMGPLPTMPVVFTAGVVAGAGLAHAVFVLYRHHCTRQANNTLSAEDVELLLKETFGNVADGIGMNANADTEDSPAWIRSALELHSLTTYTELCCV